MDTKDRMKQIMAMSAEQLRGEVAKLDLHIEALKKQLPNLCASHYDMFAAMANRIRETNDIGDVNRIIMEPRDGDLVVVVYDGCRISLYSCPEASTDVQHIWYCDTIQDMVRRIATTKPKAGE